MVGTRRWARRKTLQIPLRYPGNCANSNIQEYNGRNFDGIYVADAANLAA
jgi:hypothetical protein